jgi:hypothetical protein
MAAADAQDRWALRPRRRRLPLALALLALLGTAYLFWCADVRAEDAVVPLSAPLPTSANHTAQASDVYADFGPGDDLAQAGGAGPSPPSRPAADEAVVFALIMYGHDSAREGAVLIKVFPLPLPLSIFC